jgi:hypothetical protein
MYLSEVDQFTFHANQNNHQYQNVASTRPGLCHTEYYITDEYKRV